MFEHRAPGADVPPSPGGMADCCPLVHSSLYRRADQNPTALHPLPDVSGVPFCSPRAASNATAVRAARAWRRSRCGLASMCAIKRNVHKHTANAAEDAFSVFRAAPHLSGITFRNNLSGIRSRRLSPSVA